MSEQKLLKFAAIAVTIVGLGGCAVFNGASMTDGASKSTLPVNPIVVPPPKPELEAKLVPQTVRLGKYTGNPLGLVAQDFLQALLQVPGFSSVNNRIGTRPIKSGFERAVVSKLQGHGYRFVTTDQQNGRNMIKTRTIRNPENKDEVTFILELYHLAIKRTYVLKPNYVRPISGLFVKGVSHLAIELDDRIFVENLNI